MKAIQTIKSSSGIVVLAVAILAISSAVTFTLVRPQSVPVASSRAYFSLDDGKSWFSDDASKVPPFDKDGKQAVRAYVFKSEKGATFVNSLERFKPEAKRAIESARTPDPQAKRPPDTLATRDALTTGREVKRPGDPTWVQGSSYREAAQITVVKCPDGGQTAIPVEP